MINIYKLYNGFGSKRSLVRIQSRRPVQVIKFISNSFRKTNRFDSALTAVLCRFRPLICVSIGELFVDFTFSRLIRERVVRVGMYQP